MLFFENDYGAGAHPEVLRRLAETNMTQVSGYGSDPFSASAREKIRAACEDPEADVEFLVGGTQANAVVLASLLADHEGVIAAQTGHIHVHEAGAVEYTGHKILALPQTDGKLAGADIERLLASFYADETHDHMVFPGAVYLSHPQSAGRSTPGRSCRTSPRSAAAMTCASLWMGQGWGMVS